MNAVCEPLGLRLHNPGCIRASSIEYVGEVHPSESILFKQFETPVYGLRTICMILKAYWAHDGVKTIREAITRWAPPEDANPTDAYVANAARGCMVDADTPVMLSSVLRPLVRSIVTQECGTWPYSDELLDQAVSLSEEE